MPRPLKRPQPPVDPYKTKALPVGRPAAVYYRQSSEAQIGNISTTLQTIDMIEHLLHHGWVRENIHMIDMDAGVSGSKKIRERKGMSLLYDMIESGHIGLVAAQDVDRFFRDVTMIQANIFIDACKRNNVQVMTPRMVFDFAHPSMGSSHIRMFREDAQRAADYLEYQIRGRLVKARNSRSESGLWAGRKVLPGFMVDCRAKVDGQRNPDFRKYKRFDLYADVMLRYFELFRASNGNLYQTWLDIDRNGPYFPDIPEDTISDGFRVTDHLTRRSPVTGGLTPSYAGLASMLTNVAYIGHWIHQGAVVAWDNHEPVIPLELFMYAYNRLSPTDFYGEPNPQYIPYRPWTRHNKADRNVPPPTYAGLIFSDDLPDKPHARLASMWKIDTGRYQYQLYAYPYRSNVWNISALILDGLVDGLLLARLKATTVDEKSWSAALAGVENVDQAEVRRIRAAIRQAESAKDNLIASLSLLSNPEMVAHAQARYEMVGYEIAELKRELANLQAGARSMQSLAKARPVLEQVIERWEHVPHTEKRALFEALAKYIKVSKVTRHAKWIEVMWRDGSVSRCNSVEASNGYFWEPEALDRLRTMIEDDADQVDILRAFPGYSWRALQGRYSYNFGGGRWRTQYAGKISYNRNCLWEDTEEYGAIQQATQSTATGGSLR